MPDPFDEIEHAPTPSAAFDLLTQKLREEKNYPLLFEALLMRRRRELGLPLVQSGSIDDLSGEQRTAYEQAFLAAAREVGSLFLADGSIPRAWPYFRAIGDQAPVTAAIEALDSKPEDLDRILEIALEERVHPRKGFELMLAHYGICRAITYFEQYSDAATREASLALLVRTLHSELIENLKRAIAQREGEAPETTNVAELIAGRDWLFGDLDYYVDTSHLIAIIRYALDLTDPELLRLAIDLCDYGGHLSPTFKYRTDPPFDDVYRDHAAYLRALAGIEVEAGIQHFRKKVETADPEQSGSAPAQVLVALLVRLKRYRDAIDVSLQYLSAVPPAQLACPSIPQLCQFAGDYELLRKLSRKSGDLLNFTAATLS